ncbi:MAG: transcriptional regulator [Candidatus Thermoplasmatota archaeon]|nr:transcriptional regulator [Candidatus Thermoplasmatota archaeon]
MIEIVGGSTEEQIIDILQNTYPVTVDEVQRRLHLSYEVIMRVLQRFQVKGIIQLEPLPDMTYIRLIRHDIKIVSKKRQKKFIKHHRRPQRYIPKEKDDDHMFI